MKILFLFTYDKLFSKFFFYCPHLEFGRIGILVDINIYFEIVLQMFTITLQQVFCFQ